MSLTESLWFVGKVMLGSAAAGVVLCGAIMLFVWLVGPEE